jgi:hypothetical protein
MPAAGGDVIVFASRRKVALPMILRYFAADYERIRTKV